MARGMLSMLTAAALMIHTGHANDSPNEPIYDTVAAGPIEFGFVLFPSFQALDVFGPLDTLNMFSWQRHMNLHLIAETLDPASTAARSAAMNKFNSSFAESVVPTHTFENAPPLEVLFVPGGVGTRSPDITSSIDFVASRYPELKYLVSVCTGAGILARAGVLDGKTATTNKNAWNATTALGPKTNWIAHARWVEDGNVWTTSGVAAGIDGTLAWIEKLWGNDTANGLAISGEVVRNADWRNDPFGYYHNLTDVPAVE